VAASGGGPEWKRRRQASSAGTLASCAPRCLRGRPHRPHLPRKVHGGGPGLRRGRLDQPPQRRSALGAAPASTRTIHISLSSDNGRKPRQGIHLHRRAALVPTALIRRYGIPVTKPAQTIADLRGGVPPAQLRRAIRQAEVLGLPIGAENAERTRSELEHLFLRLCERHGIAGRR
jgi:hypothetical protein